MLNFSPINMFGILVLLGIQGWVSGECIVGNMQTVQSFDMNKFMGRWYEYMWYSTDGDSRGNQSKDRYQYFVPTTTVTYNYVSSRNLDDTCSTTHGVLSPTAESGKFLRKEVVGGIETQIPFWVLETDYTGYALVYGCVNISAPGTCFDAKIWILTRAADVPQSIKDKVPGFLDTSCLDADEFMEIEKTTGLPACEMPRLYTINPQSPCLLSTIQVQEGFDAKMYGGVWYEIRWLNQDFPEDEIFKDFQREFVPEDDGKMATFSRGRLAKCTYWMAGMESGSTPGKYAFQPNEPTGDQFWIVDTDYENFAVAYGCSNVTSDNQCALVRVSVWSRRPRLAPSFQQRANLVIIERLCVNPAAFLWTRQDIACPPQMPEEKECPVSSGERTTVPLLLTFVLLRLL